MLENDSAGMQKEMIDEESSPSGRHDKDRGVRMQVATAYDDQLLATKFFMPASSHSLIPRPRLISQLNESLHHSLTLLSAPAGFGKTTLLSDWIQLVPSLKPLVAWISLDEGDNDPARFWTYVLTA